MLRITKLADAEYLIGQVALGIDDYYVGAGEAPGVWQGQLADELGLWGVVNADQLRALLLGRHPGTDAELLGGHRERKVAAFDVRPRRRHGDERGHFGGDNEAGPRRQLRRQPEDRLHDQQL